MRNGFFNPKVHAVFFGERKKQKGNHVYKNPYKYPGAVKEQLGQSLGPCPDWNVVGATWEVLDRPTHPPLSNTKLKPIVYKTQPTNMHTCNIDAGLSGQVVHMPTGLDEVTRHYSKTYTDGLNKHTYTKRKKNSQTLWAI